MALILVCPARIIPLEIVRLIEEFDVFAMDNEFQTPQILAVVLTKAQTLQTFFATGRVDA
jgi:hypothetical protein